MGAEKKNGSQPAAFSGPVAADDAGGMVMPGDVQTGTGGPQNGKPVALDAPSPADPPWLRIAKSEVGTRETPGTGDNPRVVAYHKTTSFAADHDEVPWCSSFVNWVMLKAHMERTNSAAAKSWLNWGYAIEKPCLGAVAVLKRPGGHHVGFVVKYDGKRVWLVGGNQSDAVNVSSFDMGSVLGFRWPHGYAETGAI